MSSIRGHFTFSGYHLGREVNQLLEAKLILGGPVIVNCQILSHVRGHEGVDNFWKGLGGWCLHRGLHGSAAAMNGCTLLPMGQTIATKITENNSTTRAHGINKLRSLKGSSRL